MKNKNLKKMAYGLVTIIAALAIMIGLASCKDGSGSGEMETFDVIMGDIVQTVTTTGYVESQASNNYSLQSSGTVLQVLKEGDTFMEGDVLIKIDNSRNELMMDQAEENLNIAKVSLELAKLSLQQALDANHISVQLAETNTEASELASQNALIAIENANEYLSSIKSYIAVPSYQKDQASSNVDSAEGGYEQALNSQSLTNWSNLSSTQAAEAQIEITKQNIKQAETQVRLAGISTELAGLELDSGTILAPYDGIVRSSTFKKGEYAGQGIRAIDIFKDEFIIVSDINEIDIVNMEIGHKVGLSFDAYYGQDIRGEISKISPLSINIGGVVSFKITVEPETGNGLELLEGLSTSLTIITSGVEDILYIPIQAVFEEDEKQYVDIVTGENETERVEVSTGIFSYDYIEIKSGLKEGDTIVISFNE